jgi:uncharacterized membrane protein YjgN (DUF898 family)
MKILAVVLTLATIIVFLGTLNGCATREYTMLTKQVADYGIQRFEDKEKNVVCYVYRDNDSNSMTCLKSVR